MSISRNTQTLFIFIVIGFFFVTGQALAQTVITGDQSTSVSVTNSVNSSTSTSTSTDSYSNVRVEQNGEVKTFESHGEDIHYVSDDESIRVNIQNSGSTKNTDASGDVMTITDEAKEFMDQNQKIADEFEMQEDKEKADKESAETLPTGHAFTLSEVAMSVISTVPGPLSPVQKLFTLIQTTLSLL